MIRQGLVLLLVVAATIIGWRLLDGEIDAATVEGPLHGVTYAPWAKDQDPIEAKASGVYSFLRTAFTDTPPPAVKPRKEQIERDFAMLAGKVNYVRTYRTSDGGEVMPEIAARNGLKLVPGAWIYSANEAKQHGEKAYQKGTEVVTKCKEALDAIWNKHDYDGAQKKVDEAKASFEEAKTEGEACYKAAEAAMDSVPQSVKAVRRKLRTPLDLASIGSWSLAHGA